MFQKAELERLQKQKELLVLQSDVNRLLLAADWQRLRSPANWLNETGSVIGGLGRLGELASTAFSVWKLIRGKKAEE